MRLDLDRVRRGLTDNKVFFETVTATSLAVMAVVVAVAQTCTAAKQTDLLALQTRLAEAQSLPQFRADLALIGDERGHHREVELILTSHGGLAYDLAVDAITFLTLDDITIHHEPQRLLEIPVNGRVVFLRQPLATGGTKLVARGRYRDVAYDRVAMATLAAARSQGWSQPELKLRVILRVAYLDVLARPQIEYFELRPFSGSTTLPRDEGSELFMRWVRAPRYDLSRITPEQLAVLVKR